MASVVDLCNLSLARLGDEANVVSIEPPDGSAQAAGGFDAIAHELSKT